ncbi:hypothetical protein V9T40_000846 [Parthenolecanium corni]|uniref:Platelet-derived growth factor (PDGF) family profile domain-containing protein n=1 Tax=Parthenolecanium corni TaxID=536013 RepID=A0AAN9TAB7_9HEMI
MEKGGNKQAINQLFQQIYKTSPPASVNKEEQKRLDGLANEHVVRAREETHCKKPTPISVRVSDVYHHPHKTYAPPCTRLYQCTEKSGCCSEPKRCMPYKTETVTLYFKVFTKIRGGTTDATVEALTFQNDTECRCKNTSIMNSGTGNSSLAETELQDESLSE